MLTQIDDYGDLAGPTDRYSDWNEQGEKYDTFNRYFYGEIFDEIIAKTEGDESADQNPLYPLKINLVKMMVMTHTQMMMGQWEDEVMNFRVDTKRKGQRLDQWSEEAKDFIVSVWRENDLNGLMMQALLSTGLYGGSVLKYVSDYSLYNRVRIDHILPEYFFPRWHPFNPTKLTEVWVEVKIPVEDAIINYGYRPPQMPAPGEKVLYREHWSDKFYDIVIKRENAPKDTIGQHVIVQEKNPYGFIPFEYIPRIRPPGAFYGLSVCEDTMGPQDELNMRLADIGERINYSSHPVWILKNFTGDSSDFVIGPDEIFDLGVAMGGLEPDMKMVEPPGEPSSTFQYLEMVLDLAKRGAMSPPIAFGEDQGSQRSALTLEFRMWPLIQQAKWARANWTSAIERINNNIIRIRAIKDDMEKRPPEDTIKASLLGHRILPKWRPILPRDRTDLVEETIKAWSQGPLPLISVEAAVEKLAFTDDHDQEKKRVLALHEELKRQEIEVEEAGANQMQPESSKPTKKKQES